MSEKCTWKNCSGDWYAAGLCSVHYNRRLRTGTCEPGPRAHRPFSERLWSKIEKRGPDECWPWIAKEQVKGYGKLRTGGRGSPDILAHRAVWEETNGRPIPDDGPKPYGWVVMHTCDNRKCCNPKHLVLGAQSENVRDMDRKGRRKTVSHPGSKRPKAKHTEDQIRAFLADKDGTIKERAQRHGVTIGVAKLALYGKRWTHVK